MNESLETFFMCFLLSTSSLLVALIPKKFVKRIYGSCIGFATGSLCAVLFAGLIPELLSTLINHSYSTGFVPVSNSKNKKFRKKVKGYDQEYFQDKEIHDTGCLLSGLIFSGIFLGWFLETLLHSILPERKQREFYEEWEKKQINYPEMILVEQEEKTQIRQYEKRNQLIHERHCNHEDYYKINEKFNLHECFDGCNLEKFRINTVKEVEFQNEITPEKESSIPASVWLYTLCYFFHVITDGILIGVQKKWNIVFALASHEIPSSIGSFGYYISKNVSRTKSILLLLLQKFGFFIGNAIGLMASNNGSKKFNLYATALIIGVFIFLLFIFLIPELVNCKDKKEKFQRALFFSISIIGISIIIYFSHPKHE